MMPEFNVTEPRQLIVEGPDDRHFFEALLRWMGIGAVQINITVGKDNIRRTLRGLLVATGWKNVTSLAIIRDADNELAESRPSAASQVRTDAEAAFESVRDGLGTLGFPVPSSPQEVVGNSLRVGVMIVPPGEDVGILEDVCIRSVSERHAQCIGQYFNCLKPDLDLAKNKAKAKVQVYLASQNDVGIPLGIAAQKGYWNFRHDAFAPIRDFLTRMFG